MSEKTSGAQKTPKGPKGPKRLERHFKGVSNHRRIQILMMVAKDKEMNVEKLAERIQCDFRITSVHTHRLVQAGLLEKRYKGASVLHNLTPYGRLFVEFIETFSRV